MDACILQGRSNLIEFEFEILFPNLFTEDKLTACSYKKLLNQKVLLIISFESPHYRTANRTILILDTYGIPN